MSTHLLIRANVSKAILLEAYAIAKAFEARYSAYKEDSFLNQINKLSGKKSLTCKDEDILLFKRCIKASKDTDGAFDISMGALVHGAYHFGFSNQKIATKESIKKQKQLVNYRFIEIENNNIFLKKMGMRLDLGGIGKGYVAKEIALFLEKKGATKMLINVGGEIISKGKSYTVSIKDPLSEQNIAIIKTSKEAISISTSGDYERFIDSRENHHILDSDLGVSSNEYSSMTLIQNGLGIDILDAYATAMFNNPLESLKKFAKKQNFASISIDKQNDIVFTNMQSIRLKSIEVL